MGKVLKSQQTLERSVFIEKVIEMDMGAYLRPFRILVDGGYFHRPHYRPSYLCPELHAGCHGLEPRSAARSLLPHRRGGTSVRDCCPDGRGRQAPHLGGDRTRSPSPHLPGSPQKTGSIDPSRGSQAALYCCHRTTARLF